MTELWLHPSLIFLAGAALLPLIPQRIRPAFLLLVPLLAFARVQALVPGIYGEVPYLAWDLVFGRVDTLATLFGYIFTLMALLGTLYALNTATRGELAAAWVYVAGALGAVYAGDLLTLFLFWELMAFSSVFLIWLRGSPTAIAAGFRYLLVHAAGGAALLAGLIIHGQSAGSLAFNAFNVQQPGLGAWLILVGFLLNAAVPPLHAWLPDGYGEATVGGAVFLCAFTTKTAVYALVRGFAGMEILIWLGVVMTLYGVLYAAMENDSRRLLSYHIISQVGYMVAGTGIGTNLALNGVCAHAFAHILYKGLLFMGCGAVVHMTGQSRFTELGGLYRKMPWTLVFTLIGGFSISAFPLFSGFVSKSMTVKAAFDEHLLLAAFLLVLASSGTFLSVGLKIPCQIWFGRRCSRTTWQKAADPPWHMTAAMAITGLLCLFIGIHTPYLYDMLPFRATYEPYTSYHLAETMQVLCFTMLMFFLLKNSLAPKEGRALDTDWFYRRGSALLYRFSDHVLNGCGARVQTLVRRGLIPALGRFFAAPGATLQIGALRLLERSGLWNGPRPETMDSIQCRSRTGGYPVGSGVLLAVLYLAVVALLFML